MTHQMRSVQYYLISWALYHSHAFYWAHISHVTSLNPGSTGPTSFCIVGICQNWMNLLMFRNLSVPDHQMHYGICKLGQFDLIKKFHNAPVPYSPMHHFVTEMCTHVHISVTK